MGGSSRMSSTPTRQQTHGTALPWRSRRDVSVAALSWKSSAKIAAREMHSSRGKFFFVILSVAIGVAALTGVRGFSSSFRAALLNRARSIMAADLSARMFMQPTPEQQKGLDAIEQQGIEMTPVTELLSMASAAKTLDPLLV